MLLQRLKRFRVAPRGTRRLRLKGGGVREQENEGPAEWIAAWQAHGEVVLPHRRRTLWWRAGLTFVLTANSSLSLVHNLQDRDEPLIYLVVMVLAIPCWAWFFGYTTWQLVTGRPILRIDQIGIHYGTRRRYQIPWERIETISDPIGTWLFAYVNIRPYNEKPQRIPINHAYVDELHLFALWLRARLEEQRNSASR
ncbi:hypothetical protein [Kribbella sp. NPDC051718]|uniref:hypothetical protein n=1 Tax=Kribbella sp. NPDC051718 TaxID=3155168 RepID=UPI003429579B